MAQHLLEFRQGPRRQVAAGDAPGEVAHIGRLGDGQRQVDSARLALHRHLHLVLHADAAVLPAEGEGGGVADGAEELPALELEGGVRRQGDRLGRGVKSVHAGNCRPAI